MTAAIASPTTSHSALQVLDPSSGEITEIIDAPRLLRAAGIDDPATADDVALAATHVHITHVGRVLSEAKRLLNGELVARMDFDASWTRDIPGYKATTDSPVAGTHRYDGEILYVVVSAAVAAGVISQTAADNAVAVVPPTTSVPYPLLWQIRDALQGQLDMADLSDVVDAVASLLTDEPAPTYKQRPAGINALLKHPGMAPALQFIQLHVTPPPRKVTVTPIKPRGA